MVNVEAEKAEMRNGKSVANRHCHLLPGEIVSPVVRVVQALRKEALQAAPALAMAGSPLVPQEA